MLVQLVGRLSYIAGRWEGELAFLCQPERISLTFLLCDCLGIFSGGVPVQSLQRGIEPSIAEKEGKDSARLESCAVPGFSTWRHARYRMTSRVIGG
jgi:hypothetical protein